MFLQRVLQLERHPTVLAGEVSDVGVNLEMDVIGGDLVKGLPTLLAAPAVAPDTVGPEVDVHTVPGLELLAALITAEGTVCNIILRVMSCYYSIAHLESV